MNKSENIIKKGVLSSRTNFKEGLEGTEYSDIIKNRSRRRRTPLTDKTDDDELVCPVCGSTKVMIDFIRSEKSCMNCGMVLEENIIDSTIRGTARDKEGNSYGQNGAPKDIAIHDGGMATVFNVNNGYLHDRQRWYRIKRLNNQSRVSDPRQRNLSRALGEMALIISNLSLSKNVKYESASLYRKALDKDLIRGRSISKLIVATVYIGCKVCKVPRTLDEMAEVSSVDKKTIARNYRFLSRELGLKLPIVTPNDYVPRFASKLGLSSEVEVKSIEINNQAMELGLTSGKDPASVTAASLYWASMLVGERRTQTEIAKTLGVTEVTIRNRFKELSSKVSL